MGDASQLKHNQRRMLIPRIHRGLILLALLILLVGGAISYGLYRNRKPSDLNQNTFRLCAAVTVVLAGVSLISATSGYWMRRP